MASPLPSGTLPTGVQLTCLDPVFREDPYPIFATLREREPIHQDRQLEQIVFTRHDDVFAILRNPAFLSDPRNGTEGSFARTFLSREGEEPSMLLMDDPDHRRLRELVRHPFAPRAVARWRDRARAVARRTIGGIDREQFDLVEVVANPIPTVVIAELLGIDSDLHTAFKNWSDDVIKVAFSPVNDPADVERADRARESLDQFFLAEIERRRSQPGEDLVSAMVRAEESGDRLSNREIVLQCNLLLLAGNLTTSDLIGNAVMALVRNPDQQKRLREDRSLMKNAVEEVLRFDSPVTYSGRIAHEDFEWDGVDIKQGDTLSVALAAANRDPETYPDPDRFDVGREDTHHQSFGGGRHFCLGAHLARLEAAETLDALLDRFTEIDFGDGHEYASNPGFRGLSRFSVRVAR